MAWPKGKPRGPKPTGPVSEVHEEILADPKPEVLGTIKESVLREDVAADSTWIAPDGTVVNLKGAPPWAMEAQKGMSKTDARIFVDFPKDWVVRWQNPRLIDQRGGYNGWLPMTASDPRVKVKVTQMRDPANLIRRGYGDRADILTFMPLEWYDKRIAEKNAHTKRMAGEGRIKQEQFREDARRGRFGPHIRPGYSDSDPGFKTPAATQFDGRALVAAESQTKE
jgi:hypothetical protein